MTEQTPATPGLDEQICFALYNASRAITLRYRDLLTPLGITYPQYLVLLVLWEGGEIGVSGLGARLQLDSGTLSPLLRRLESAGLVTRTRSGHDERTVSVSLTARGRSLQGEAAHIPAQICAATGLDRPDLQVLQQQIATLADSVRANS